jgi:hypothetical protein
MPFANDKPFGPLLGRITVILGLAALSCGQCGAAAFDEREEKEVAKLEAMGSKVHRNDEGSVVGITLLSKSTDEDIAKLDFGAFPHLEHLAVFSKHVTDKSFDRFHKIPNLVSVNIKWTRVSDDGFVRFLKKQKNLYGVMCDQMPITGKGLEGLGAIGTLRSVWVSNTAIGDEGVKEIAKLDKLFALELPETKITDAALTQILNLKDLAFLRVDGNMITDTGIQQLHMMTRLRHLEVRSTQVTDDGKATLQQILPRLMIVR